MQIKKYIASTLREATEKMKSELGSEAIILSNRVIEADPRFGGRRMFELTAGIDNLPATDNYSPRPKSKPAPIQQNDFKSELESITSKIFNSSLNKKPFNPAEPEEQKSFSPGGKLSIEKEIKRIVDVLYDNEVQKPIIAQIINQLKKYKNFLHASNIDSYVLSSISSLISTYEFELHKRNEPKKVALVGPTGVGKTTCIAKLALIAKILHNLDIGLISIDTYRLGALDQLRIFSEVSNIELLVAYETREMSSLINSFKKKDLIFIDTAGRSQKNKDQLYNNIDFLNSAGVDETYLVLSATSTSKNLQDVAKRFEMFNYKSFIFTKIDEAVAFGNIFNLLVKTNKPVSFLSNGQVIPDDIISANADFIADMIYTGKVTA